MTEDRPDPRPDLRTVELTRIGESRYKATNVRGGVLPIGRGQDPDFTPVELLLAAIAGCSAIDVDLITGKRAQPTDFDVHVEGDKVRDENGNHLTNLKVTFDITFPEGEAGDAARSVVQRSIEQSRDRLCTVSRTVALPTPVEMVQGGAATSPT
ncbi:putative redox protein [Marmoricola sp. OAE513]|uniref:OsmC family protein n=1 Tax=Marmoricola sp. OAE513 TaxID=2817894 RepID=UPI001AE14DEF